MDSYSAAAYVNHSVLYYSQKKYAEAKDELYCALSNDASCIEAIYNLGKAMIIHKIK